MKLSNWGIVACLAAILTIVIYRATRPATLTAPFRVSVPAYEGSALIRLADRLGYFADEGLDVTIDESHRKTQDALDLLVEGHVEMAVVGEQPIARGIAPLEKILILSTIYESEYDMKIVALKTSAKTPKDLRGKKVAATAGTGRDYCLAKLLAKHGVGWNEFQYETGEPAEQAKKLRHGKLDAACLREPDPFFLDRSSRKKFIIFAEPGTCRTSLSLLLSVGFHRRYPAVAEKTLRALIRAEEFWKTHEEYSVGLLADDLGLDFDYLRHARNSGLYRVRLNQHYLRSLEEKAKWMHEHGLSRYHAIPDFRAALYPAALKLVDSSRVEF